MSRRTLALLCCLFPAALSAQVSEAVLRHRITVLTAKQAELQRRLTQRDSLALAGAELTLIGKAPLYLRVPAWVVPATAAPVAAIVDSWTVRVGPIFTQASPETLVIALRNDTAGWSRREVASLIAEFPDVVRFNARRAAQARVQRMIGGQLTTWLGMELPAVTFDLARRDGIDALISDTSGVGSKCLDGDVPACVLVIRSPGPLTAGARRSFLAAVVERPGTRGWSGLAADTTKPVEARISALDGASFDRLVGAWIVRLRAPHPAPPAEYVGSTLLALAWAGTLLLLFLWGLTWHRA